VSPLLTLPAHVRAWVFGAEGGYGNDADDRGGETRWGISKKQYPEIAIANLTRERAEDIYARDYWRAVRGDELPPAVALAVFDAAVLAGPSKAVRFLQLALDKVGLDDVQADGLMGPATLHGAKLAAAEGLAALLAECLSFRGLHLVDLAVKDVTQRKFIRGWLARLFRLEATCLQIGAA